MNSHGLTLSPNTSMIFFTFRGPTGSRVNCGKEQSPLCRACGNPLRELAFGEFSIQVSIPRLVREWPFFLGSMHYTAASQQVVEVLKRKVTGLAYHRVEQVDGIHQALPEWLPYPPNYYVLEATGSIQAKIPVDEVTPCPLCGRLLKKEFGVAAPRMLDPLTWDGSDVVKIKFGNYDSDILCLNPAAINVLRKHGFHRQPWYGRQNRKSEALTIGNWLAPGLSARNLDSDNWYEDTLAALREKYPEREWE